MAKNNTDSGSTRVQVGGEVVGHVLFWGVVALIGWLFMTVLEHDRELSKRGVRINQLEKKMEKLQDSWVYYKERFKK